ncbi:MAG: protein kinase, partial [Gammaproteobacteria bacterium]|nr:protein kinase [Gammaproteobacteria bacterium]
MNDRTPRNSLDAKHQLHWYQIERVLGQGGFGITYLAYDSNLDQLVAIKEYLPMELAIRDGDNSVYPASGAMGERYDWGLERFLVEARTLAKFRHPAIVRVLSVFEANNTAYMVMEYESGESLQEIVSRQKTLSEAEIVRLIPPILNGLEVIHAEGFIHRDIKPANLFIREDGTPVLLDFGSARQALGEQTKTLTSVVSPGYAPFEQYYSKSDRQGPWTDIYGFGATLYRCVTGRQPMDAIDRSEAILKAERDIFVSAGEIGAERYSATLLSAIDHALQFREKSRPQSIAEWRLDFGLPQPSETLSQPLSLPAEPAGAGQAAAGEDDFASIDLSTGEAFAEGKLPTLPEQTVVASAPPAAPEAPVPASAPLSAAPPPPRRWLWPAVVAVLVAALAAALVYGGLGGDALRAVFDKGASSDGPRTAEELIRAQQLEQRLAQADQALADGRLLEPPLANALDLYRDVQRMDAGNAAAAAGIEKTAAAVLGKARAAAENNDFDGAYSLIATALVIKPDLEGVEDLREYIGQQKARVGARQQADARLGELLSAGQADLEAGRLAGSGTDNALARFRTVLVLDADNAQARAGINAVVEGLAAEGERLLEAGDLVEANRIVANLRGIDAGHPTTEAFAAEYETVAAEADAAKQDTARVDELLRAGDAALRANRLTSPAGNNALEKYRAVLKITPDNNRALAGVDAVVDKYAWLAEQAAVDGDTEQAERFLGKARGIAPGSARVRALEE